jgi:hypothetical protein
MDCKGCSVILPECLNLLVNTAVLVYIFLQQIEPWVYHFLTSFDTTLGIS